MVFVREEKEKMEEFVSNLYTDAYNKLTEQYHRDINDLESKKRSVGDVTSRFDLTFLPPVPLPEFEVQEVVFDESVTNIQYLQEDFVLVYTYDHIYTVQVSTGATVRTAPRDFRSRYYQYKRIVYDGPRYEETEEEIILPEVNNWFSAFHIRNGEGRVQGYEIRHHLLSHNEAFRFQNELQLGDHYVRSLRNVITKEEIGLFTAEGFQTLFRYRGEWYEYGGVAGQRKVWHCRSRALQPYTWENKYIHVQGDTIILQSYDGDRDVLQFLRPRPE